MAMAAKSVDFEMVSRKNQLRVSVGTSTRRGRRTIHGRLYATPPSAEGNKILLLKQKRNHSDWVVTNPIQVPTSQEKGEAVQTEKR